jgi:hypothetical protein
MLRMFRNQPDLSHVKGLDVAESWTKDPVKLKSTLLLKACNRLIYKRACQEHFSPSARDGRV